MVCFALKLTVTKLTNLYYKTYQKKNGYAIPYVKKTSKIMVYLANELVFRLSGDSHEPVSTVVRAGGFSNVLQLFCRVLKQKHDKLYFSYRYEKKIVFNYSCKCFKTFSVLNLH